MKLSAKNVVAAIIQVISSKELYKNQSEKVNMSELESDVSLQRIYDYLEG